MGRVEKEGSVSIFSDKLDGFLVIALGQDRLVDGGFNNNLINKRLNSQGCLAALVTGFGMGLFRLAIDTPVKLIDNFAYTEGSFFWVINNMFFQYYSLAIFFVCVIVMIVVSYMTEAPSYERIHGLTFSTTAEEDRERSRASWATADVVTSVSVLLLILLAYGYFTG